jgi:mRNA interferase HicA
MKREEFIKHLRLHGCEFLREGGNHTVYVNRREKKASTVPRHRESGTSMTRDWWQC